MRLLVLGGTRSAGRHLLEPVEERGRTIAMPRERDLPEAWAKRRPTPVDNVHPDT